MTKIIWLKPNKAHNSAVLILPPFEANVLKYDYLPFTFYPYNKITKKTIDKTKQ